jgi:hypothetical protein
MSGFRCGNLGGSNPSASGGTSPGSIFQEFTVTVATDTFTVTLFTVVSTKTKVFIDGILLPSVNYTISGNVITTAYEIGIGSIVTVFN